MHATTASSPTFGERRAAAIYDLGHSTIFAARSDPRFAYCTYAPPSTGAEPLCTRSIASFSSATMRSRCSFAAVGESFCAS